MDYFRLNRSKLACCLIAGTACFSTFAGVTASPVLRAGFPVNLASGDGFVNYSSIALGDVDGDGKPEIVFGTSAGFVEVYKGNGTRLWHYSTNGSGIESKPVIADVNGDGSPEVIVTFGSQFTPGKPGGIVILNANGTLHCSLSTNDTTGDGISEGAFSSPAVAPLDPAHPSKLKVVFGAWDVHVRAINDDCSIFWDKSVADRVVDTVWSSPAIADIDGDGTLEVVIGADSQPAGPPLNTIAGGMIYVFRGNGSGELPGFPVFVDEVIYSSVALANIDNDPQLEIIVGTGNCWEVPACAGAGNTHQVTDAVYAFKYNGQPVPGWPVSLDAGPARRYAFASPALADLDGDGKPEVIINARQKGANSSTDGWTYVINGNGTLRPGWPKQPSTPADCSGNVVHHGTDNSPIAVDLTGDGIAEIVVPSNGDLVVWDRDGNQLSRPSFQPGACLPAPGFQLSAGGSIGGAAAAGDLDGNGQLTLIVSSTIFPPPQDHGALYAWDFNLPIAPSLAAWPEFRRNAGNRATWRPDNIFRNGFN